MNDVNLKINLKLLLEAAKHAQCDCSPLERASGHQVGCWMPPLRAAIDICELALKD